MINNNHIDKNGTLALTFDLICRPLCTLWCIQYHNHAWVHLVWRKGGKINVSELISKGKASHLQILCWRCIAEQTQSCCLLRVMLKRPLIHRLTYSPASVQQQALRGTWPPLTHTHTHRLTPPPLTSPPLPLLPSTNMIPPEGSPQTSFLINACGWWDHPVSAN